MKRLRWISTCGTAGVLTLAISCGGATPPPETPPSGDTAERPSAENGAAPLDSNAGELRPRSDAQLPTGGAPKASPDGPPPPAELEREYARFDFPELSGWWSAKDYERASEALKRVIAETSELVPQREGPGRALFERFASQTAYTQAVRGEKLARDLLSVHAALGGFVEQYQALVTKEKRKDLGSEWLELTSHFVQVMPVAFGQLNQILERAPANKPALGLLATLRLGLVYQSYRLTRASSAGTFVPQNEYLDEFARHSRFIGSLLLEREKKLFREGTRNYICPKNRRAEVKEMLENFTETELHPLIAAHLEANEKLSARLWRR